MCTIRPKVGLAIVMSMLEFWIVLKVFIVWLILLIWQRIKAFLFGLSDFRLSWFLLDELNSLLLGEITGRLVDSPNWLSLDILAP